ncbi:TonB-dependent receptor domain-containing protein [Barnesiella viscericola]|uniref:TonB-dependent receptor n=1 Tax=Barnesiella viscericola TaxID=397865 RepID=UPI003D18D3C9
MGKIKWGILLSLYLYNVLPFGSLAGQAQHRHHREGHPAAAIVSGRVSSTEGGAVQAVDFATVYLKGGHSGGTTDEQGRYRLKTRPGDYTLVVSAIGYEPFEKPISLKRGEHLNLDITLTSKTQTLDEVTVVATGVNRVKRSAYNAVAVDTREMQNSTKNLSDALAKAPGMKLRESGGVGSDMQLMLDGFSGKHVKVFIDGVPQEGVGSSFGLNNIPISFADRIEIYKGVVPVGFGTDAIGGVINIVTNKQRRNWFLDAAYSYGSFNTHKSYLNFGQSFKSGLTYEINLFQNYSDNNYWVDADHVEQWNADGSSIITDEVFRVRRFNDTYHNEAVVAKVGVTDKPWADRLMLGFTYSQMYKEIQTGVRQHTVFGEKHRRGHSLMPSLEYRKRDLLTRGLDLTLTANYNRNVTHNIDTASYRYNWLGERRLNTNGRGEQSEQYARAYNDNWNATATLNYRIGRAHTLTFNHVWNAFHRTNTSLLTGAEIKDEFAKETRKNISGLSYRLMPSDRWNLSVFGKYYHQYVSGPVATDDKGTDYVLVERTVQQFGYGAAGTYFVLPGLQAKLSYERACRLPTIEEMFGDEDLESGQVDLRPEKSHNVNLNLSYARTIGPHSFYIEGGLIYRNTRDYIQRNIQDLSGGKENATYTNYGKVVTKGYNLSARYGLARWLSLGGNFSQMDVRDMEPYQIGSTGNSTPNLTYKARMANVPYLFADSDISLYWHDLGRKGNLLTLTYDNQYLHSFCYNSEVIGTNSSAYMIPDQFSHNLSISYSLHNGRYNLAFECRNFTDEKLYDNFSLQKAGRAFYGKIRVHFGD